MSLACGKFVPTGITCLETDGYVQLLHGGADMAFLNSLPSVDHFLRSDQRSLAQGLHHSDCFFRRNGYTTGSDLDLPDGGLAGYLHDLLCTGLTAYDLLGIGLVACDGECHVLGANQIAVSIFEGRGLRISAGGVLCGTEESGTGTDCSLRKAVRRTLSSRNGEALLVHRSSRHPGFTVLVRAAGANGKAPADVSIALLLILDPSLRLEARSADLQQLYGLAPSEARLANLLMQGMSLEDCCDALGIRCSTGRTHLRRLFKKTGVRRQSQLVALLLKSIGLVQQRGHAACLDLRPGLHAGRRKRTRIFHVDDALA